MTDPTPDLTQPAEAAPAPVLNYDAANTELLDAHAEYTEAKAAAGEAEKRYKAATARLKTRLTEAFPESQRSRLQGPGGPTLELDYRESWRFDAKTYRADCLAAGGAALETYVRYATKSGAWYLNVVKG